MAGGFSSGFSNGFDIGAGTTPTLTHRHGGYWPPPDLAEFRRRIDETQKTTKRSSEKRKEANQRLSDLIERTYRNLVEGEPEAAAELIAIVRPPTEAATVEALPAPSTVDWSAIRLDLGRLSGLLDQMERQRQARIAFEREDDDITVLLLSTL